MRRRATGSEQRSHREFDFLADVEPERLQALGAIGLAWNWIEGAIDTALCVALNLHPSMWLEVVGRVNGMDGKIALLKKQTRLYLDSIDKEAADAACKVFNAVENYKKAPRWRDPRQAH